MITVDELWKEIDFWKEDLRSKDEDTVTEARIAIRKIREKIAELEGG